MRYPMGAPGWCRGCWLRLRIGGGRLAQRESASFTPRRSLVRSQYRPPSSPASCDRVTGHFSRPGRALEIAGPGEPARGSRVTEVGEHDDDPAVRASAASISVGPVIWQRRVAPGDDWPSCGPARGPRKPRPARPRCPAPAREASRCSVVVVPVPYADREHRPARRLTIEAAVTP